MIVDVLSLGPELENVFCFLRRNAIRQLCSPHVLVCLLKPFLPDGFLHTTQACQNDNPTQKEDPPNLQQRSPRG